MIRFSHESRLAALGCLLASAVFVSTPATAGNVPKGVTVVRSGDPTNAGSYDEVDGKVQGASAVCAPATGWSATDLIATYKGRNKDKLFQNPYGKTISTTLINGSASVVTDPVKGNPNHCLISGIKVKAMTSAWQLCTLSPNQCQ